jgi:dienelactone hydrolase
MRLRLAVFASLIAGLWCTSASAATIPDPVAPGPDTVTKVEYYGGSVMMSAPQANGTSTAAFQQPLDGALFFPNGPGPFDVVVLIHGNHADCLTPTGAETTTSFANCSATPGNVPILNYEGYDYLATNLASHGFIVLSLDADALTSFQTSQDNGTLLREQLISASLDMVYAWEDGAPLYTEPSPGVVQASPPQYSTPYALAGHINLQNGVGIWGHSRGGEAVTDFVAYNRTRPAPGRKYRLDAVMAWAPVDYERASVYGTATNGVTPAPIAYASVLPLCDGDVSDIHGARDYMNSLYPQVEPTDPSPKMQFAFQGGDHDYTNAIWASSVSEDGNGYSSTNLSGTTRSDAACGEDQPNNVRLTPQDQQTFTVALTSAFMRRYVQGNLGFDPLMTGEASLPANASGQTRGVAPAEELKTSYWAPAAQRENVIQPAPGNLTSDILGGALSGTGFQNPYQSQYCVGGTCEPGGVQPVPATTPQGFDWCDPEPVEFRTLAPGQTFPTAAKSCPLPPAGVSGVYDPVAFGGQANERENHPVNRSWGPQLSLAWSAPAQLDAEIPAASGNVSGLRALAMDAAVNYFDSRNPPSGPNNPLTETNPRAAVQNFVVRLTDAEGNTADVNANSMAYGTALEVPLGSSRRNEVLNEIRIPLSDFTGVDLTQVRKISLVFGTTTPSGSIQLANVRFQEAVNQPATDPVIGAPPTNAPTGAQVPLGAGSTGTTPASAGPLSQGGPTAKPLATDAVPLNGTDTVASSKVCADRTAPASHLLSALYRAGHLTVTGWATDRGCKATRRGQKSVRGSVLRVLVSVARLQGKGCEFLGPNGRLRAATSCATDYGLVAKGGVRFALRLRSTLPSGHYLLRIQAIDRSGNLEPARGVQMSLRKGTLAR